MKMVVYTEVEMIVERTITVSCIYDSETKQYFAFSEGKTADKELIFLTLEEQEQATSYANDPIAL